MLTLPDQPDPLGVLSSTLPVVQQATAVRIDLDAVEQLALRVLHRDFPPPEWESDLHWSGDPDATANYVLVLDALNFCFWADPRWTVHFRGERFNGYFALAGALTRALEQGIPLTDAEYLSNIDEPQLASILAGENQIPLLPQRVENLRQVGELLLDRYDGQFSRLVAEVDGSAVALVQRVVRELPSFNDVARYRGRQVRFYKRAQILASDLAGAFHHRGLGDFHDLRQLTAFADYKVPQVLHHLAVLSYDQHLSRLLDQRVEIPASDPLEVEIRAATIWGVEILRRALEEHGTSYAPFQLDWMLWQLGQDLPANVQAYHRTLTIFY